MELPAKNNNDVCICIPARYASTRLPGKLLYTIGSKSCIQLTIENCLLTGLPVYVLTDNDSIRDHVIEIHGDCNNVNIIIANQKCNNGTERISKNLDKIPEWYTTIVNVQADEPFINYKNILHAIDKHKSIRERERERKRDPDSNTSTHFYTTLHQPLIVTNESDLDYLNSTSCITVTTTLQNKVLTYSRNIIPWNKKAIIDKSFQYKIFTGVYVFNRNLLELYHTLPDSPLQLMEDIEQLKILEHDYTIYSFDTLEFNEISLNDYNDYEYLCNRYLV